jgi:NAD-dependent histone deacetylase SIR2
MMSSTTNHEQQSIEKIAAQIKNGSIKKIVVIAGAGISTSGGYPDFRTPNTGIYAKIAKMKLLPYPEAIFSAHYFKHTPEPFFAFLRGVMQLNFRPTVTHAFIALLQRMSVLEMVFTQNIDGLERAAGIPDEKVMAVHGQFGSQHCILCKTEWSTERFEGVVKSGRVPRCDNADCNGPIKPDTVMFGEPLSPKFDESTDILKVADLVLVIGTSLKVHPVAGLPSLAAPSVPRVLINREAAGDLGSRPDDILLLNDCDNTVRILADSLGWRKELEDIWKEVGPQLGDENPVLEDAIDKEIVKFLNEQTEERQLVYQGHKTFLEKHLENKMSRMPSDAEPCTK